MPHVPREEVSKSKRGSKSSPKSKKNHKGEKLQKVRTICFRRVLHGHRQLCRGPSIIFGCFFLEILFWAIAQTAKGEGSPLGKHTPPAGGPPAPCETQPTGRAPGGKLVMLVLVVGPISVGRQKWPLHRTPPFSKDCYL